MSTREPQLLEVVTKSDGTRAVIIAIEPAIPEDEVPIRVLLAGEKSLREWPGLIEAGWVTP